MRRRHVPLGLAAAFIALALLLVSAPGPAPTSVFTPVTGDGSVMPGELTLRFHDDVSPGERERLLAMVGAEVRRELPMGFTTVAVPPGSVVDAGQRLGANPAVAAVSQNVLRFPQGAPKFVPDDEFYPAQWNLRLIQMEEAWPVTSGSGVRVAVIDTGVAYKEHGEFAQAPDLNGTDFRHGYNFFDDNPHPVDDHGHGTHVAGTIAQATNNGIGVAGVAFGATVLPVKVCGPNPSEGASYGCPSDMIAAGIVWAVNNGARVINLSLGSPGALSTLEHDALEYARNSNVVVVGAAGNGNKNTIDNPAAVPGVISVGATGQAGLKASYSNFGLDLDLVAPGGDPQAEGQSSYILQNSYADYCQSKDEIDFKEFWYCPKSGTSMAAAHVSGVVAMMRALHPFWTPTQVRTVLHCTAMDVGPQGFDTRHGHGLVQAYDALVLGQSCLAAPPPPPVNTCLPPPTPTPSPTPSPSPTPELTPTPVPTPEPTPDGTPSPTPEPTPEPSPTPTPSPTPIQIQAAGPLGVTTPTPTPSVTPTPTPTPTPIPTPSPTPSVSPTPTPDVSPSPTPEPSPVGSPTPSPVQTATPPPVPTPPPTPTSAPAQPTPTPAPPPPVTLTPGGPHDYPCGDVNCDGEVNSIDALLVLRWIANIGPFAQCMGNAYVQCGDTVNTVDVLHILRYVAGLPPSVPPGCPGVG